MVVIDSSFVAGSPSALRAMAARWLAGLSRGVQRLADGVHGAASSHPSAAAELEFYVEAGAPEGALYVSGRLVGRLDGVTRL